ncbi:unnamed protein product, partial [Iphiclides podalirius]
MFVILAVAAIVIAAIFIRLYEKNKNAFCKSQKRLNGKTALVTGGTDGMGLQIAIEFAKRGARVIVACPFPKEGAEALKIIVEESGNKNVEFKHLDLACLKSVRQFTSDILKNESRLDILINNAGTAARGECKTEDGMNYVMQVNYFGQFLLTILLLPLLMKTGTQQEPSRIVNTGSILHHVGHIDVHNLNGISATNNWLLVQVYANSKIALLSFNFELARRLRATNVVVNAVDPGAVGTNIFFGINSLVGTVVKFCFQSMYKTPWEGAQTAIHVALDDGAGKLSGGYFANCNPTAASGRAYDEVSARLLWEESSKLVGLTEEEFRALEGAVLEHRM